MYTPVVVHGAVFIDTEFKTSPGNRYKTLNGRDKETNHDLFVLSTVA